MSDFEPRRAVRVNTPAFVALAGPSGSGKTRSALELATGLAGDKGKILLADTEGNRALHYADLYRFDHVEFRPPYTPERCAELIDLAESKGYTALVVDSGSDEYEGEGGLQEIRDQTNDEFWAKTKARHKHHLVNRIRRARLHVIFCLRCEERVKISKVQGRTVVETLGWQPICEKRFLYEMQSSFRFDPEAPGVPVPIKLYDIHAQFFPPDQKITREAGRRLAEWAAGGAAPPAAVSSPAVRDVLAEAWAAAKSGRAAWRAFYDALTDADYGLIEPEVDDMKTWVRNADRKSVSKPREDPFGRPPLTEPKRRGLGGESQPEGGRPGEEKPPAPPEQNSQRPEMAAAGVAERRSDANSGGRHVTEPREPSERAGEALSPGSSDPPPASPAIPEDRIAPLGAGSISTAGRSASSDTRPATGKEVMPHQPARDSEHNATAPVKAGAAPPIAIVKPHGGEPDWPATRKLLIEAFYDLMTIPDCDAFRLRHSATINALRDFAPDEFEIWDTLAATHERVRRVLHGEG